MKVHYFQRYKQKENVDTSNTMLMLSRFYEYNPDKFFILLNNLILKEDETPELSFDLQQSINGNESIPDAIISQKSFKVVVETKLYNQFAENQLIKHLNQFNNEDIKVILTLDPKPMKNDLFKKFNEYLEIYNEKNYGKVPVKHINITFKDLINAMDEIIESNDYAIKDIIEDYKSYCLEENLIPDSDKWMRAIAAGTTLQDNLELNLYYDDASRGYSEHGYIGLYNQKAIKAIGKLLKIVQASNINNEFYSESIMGESPTQDEIDRIKCAMEKSKKYGYNIGDRLHNYFIVENFIKIDFRKNSKNAIQRSKLFNLSEMLDTHTLPSTEEIANRLNNKTWEDFQKGKF